MITAVAAALCAAISLTMLNNLLIVYQLLHAVQALEQQMGVAFADHEAKLGQQQEALAKQSRKGIATLQV